MHFLSILIGFLLPVAHAQSEFAADGPGMSQMWSMICSTLPFCDVGTKAPQLIADRGMALVLPLVVGIAVCAGIYAGIQMMMGQGNSDGLSKAKTTLYYAIAGMVLMLIASSIFKFAVQVVTWFS